MHPIHTRARASLVSLALVALALVAAPLTARAQTDAASVPPALHWENLAFDPVRQRLVLFGGATLAGTYLAGTWMWNGTRWSMLADSASSPGLAMRTRWRTTPPARASPCSAACSTRATPRFHPPSASGPLCDTWSLKDSTWTRSADTTCSVAATAASTLIAPGARGPLILVEGARASLDTQPLPLRLFRRDSAGWTLLDSAGPRRPLNANGAVAYDEGASGARGAGARRTRRRRVGMGRHALATRARRVRTTTAAELRDRVRLASTTSHAHRRSRLGAAPSARRSLDVGRDGVA
jgi:hypothetical protein